jgi:hypothetical protein
MFEDSIERKYVPARHGHRSGSYIKNENLQQQRNVEILLPSTNKLAPREEVYCVHGIFGTTPLLF